MPDGIKVSSDIEPIVELVSLLNSGSARADRFVYVRRQQARCRAATEQYAKELDQLYEDIERSGNNAEWLVQAADLVRQSDAAQRERLRPGIEALNEKLASQRAPRDAQARRLIEESIAVGEAWLALPAALYQKLLKLVAERRVAVETIRRARPVQGEIDHEALTREIVARYPNILAALAK
jgi:hypothetical protein